MKTEAPKPTAAQLLLIERLEAEAVAALEREEESFRRSDTDGCLSQWANNMTARKNRMQIEILRNGGYARFPVLVDADDNVVSDQICNYENRFTFQIERSWVLSEVQAQKYGRRWIPTGARSRIQKQLGLRESDRWFPARAAIMGSGTGLSGAASAYVGKERVYS